MKELNIISFDVPYPANYGGVIDVFYKIKYFDSKGIKVHLHCFDYGKGKQAELEKYCSTVSYYPRKTGLLSFLSSIPYIVKSRASQKLRNNLLKNDSPILFEGLHTCFLLNDNAFQNRFKIVRHHNIEHEYYKYLAINEKNLLKKYFFITESKKLKRFEPVINNTQLNLAISTTDLAYFKDNYTTSSFIYTPCFHPNDKVNIKSGKGKYVLYHGKLSVPENENAAIFIIKDIFATIDTPLVIAGLNPSKKLINLVNRYQHIRLVKNPSELAMKELIVNAQVHFLWTNQVTGVKLKLLNALYNGRHCIVNAKMVEGTFLNDICLVEDNVAHLKKLITNAFFLDITPETIEKRALILQQYYSNEKNGQQMLDVITQ